MKKRVLIDATTVTPQVDGLSIYIINLIRNFPVKAFEIFDFDILINPGFSRTDLEEVIQSGKFNVIKKKIAPIGPRRDWDMFWFFLKYRKQYDVIHITSNQYPMCLRNGISTVHDITFRTYFDNPRYSFNMATWYMDMVIRKGLKKSNAVVAVSESTRNELIRQYHLGAKISNKIQVTHEGWEHLINDGNGACEEKKDLTDYLFYIGTARKHKNIHNLLLAFRIALKELPTGTKLVLAGSNKYISDSDRLVIKELNKYEERVILMGYLSNDCVRKLFSEADAFIFPSLSEGFGLPVLEAFYHNVPVLCSGSTSLPEVAGDAAIYFNPLDPADIASKILQFYQHPEVKSRLIQAGKKRLSAFSWSEVANRTIDIYIQSLKSFN